MLPYLWVCRFIGKPLGPVPKLCAARNRNNPNNDNNNNKGFRLVLSHRLLYSLPIQLMTHYATSAAEAQASTAAPWLFVAEDTIVCRASNAYSATVRWVLSTYIPREGENCPCHQQAQQIRYHQPCRGRPSYHDAH